VSSSKNIHLLNEKFLDLVSLLWHVLIKPVKFCGGVDR
jgi:hypothetical protein